MLPALPNKLLKHITGKSPPPAMSGLVAPIENLVGDVRAKREGELPFWCSDGLEPLLELVARDNDLTACGEQIDHLEKHAEWLMHDDFARHLGTRTLELVSGAAAGSGYRKALRRRALVRALAEDGGLAWGCDRATSVVERLRQVRAQSSSGARESDSLVDDFRNSLVVISFGAAGGGFQLSQDLRRFMLGYLGWVEGLIYHDYASLVGHPQSRLVTGADGVTRQLNDHWNLYFTNALEASPVMVIVASEAWCNSAWCSLERRQRMEALAAKQAPGGPAAYEPTAASRPEAAGTAGTASVYLERQAELEAEIERRKLEWSRSYRSLAEMNEGVFRTIAFGNQQGRCEVFLFTDDPHGTQASPELQQIHACVPEPQRFYHLPGRGMSKSECALELHSLCVRVTELIEDQAKREAIGSGDALYAMTMSDEMPAAQHRTGLWRLRMLGELDVAAAEAAAEAEREAALQSGREDALRRGLLFDTGPCPF